MNSPSVTDAGVRKAFRCWKPKFRINLARRFPKKQCDEILSVSLDQQKLEGMPVQEYIDLF